MTTSHKPTYHPAIGRVHAGGYRYDSKKMGFSSRELPSHMSLKVRKDLSSAANDQQKLKQALLDAEGKHRQANRDEQARQGIIAPSLSSYDDADDDNEAGAKSAAITSSSFTEGGATGSADADADGDPGAPAKVDLSQFDDSDDVPGGGPGANAASSDDDDDSDDDSDEEAELARELDLIRREREQAALKAAMEEAAAAEAAALNAINKNPLMPVAGATASAASASSAVSGVKRRWDDDVVFKNQAKGLADNKNKKRFINDTIRSDFHRSFLKKYVH